MAILKDKQERFCQEYLTDFNASAAAVRAGYSARTARQQGHRLLTNADVQARLRGLVEARLERLQIDQDRLLEGVWELASSDIGDILDMTGVEPVLRPASDIPSHARRAIAGIKVRRHTEGAGAEARTVEVTEFKLWSKPDAQDKLMRHLGLLKNQHEHSGKGGGPIPHQVSHDVQGDLAPYAAVIPAFLASLAGRPGVGQVPPVDPGQPLDTPDGCPGTAAPPTPQAGPVPPA